MMGWLANMFGKEHAELRRRVSEDAQYLCEIADKISAGTKVATEELKRLEDVAIVHRATTRYRNGTR